MTIYVFSIGETVTVNKAPAVVLSIQIDKSGVGYQVGYWLAHKWETCWIPASEVSSDKSDITKIGFKDKTP